MTGFGWFRRDQFIVMIGKMGSLGLGRYSLGIAIFFLKNFGIGTLLLGILVMALGISIYIKTSITPLPLDMLMLTISNQLSIKVLWIRIVLELTLCTAALIFDGPIGLGTIVIVFALGPLIQVFGHLEIMIFHHILMTH